MVEARSPADRWLGRVAQAKPGEGRAALWSFAYFFCLLASYYVLRPLRDEMGVAGGARNLPWLFTATFVALLAAVPALGATVALLPRRRFIPLIYNVFVLNILVFWLLLTLGIAEVVVARVFFVWITVFNVFAVSVFWSFMADLWRSEQAKRLFGFIAAGGSLGALAGPLLTVQLAKPIGVANLLIVAAVLLELAVFCSMRLEAAARDAAPPDAPAEVKRESDGERIGGGWLSGLAMIARSPYLAGIAAWVVLLSLAGTFLYLMQAEVVSAASDDPAERTRIFATIDFAAGLINIAVQALLTGRIIRRFGVGAAAAVLPFVFLAGFLVLAASPLLLVVMAFQVLQRSANFAVSNPAREVLFTVAARDEKYKAKPIIDGAVFRGADAANSWLYAALQGAGALGVQGLALVVAPVCALWLVLSLALGRMQERRARAAADTPAPPLSDPALEGAAP